AWPAAPKPVPSSTVPSASTSTAVGLGSLQPAAACDAACVSFIAGLHLCPPQPIWADSGARQGPSADGQWAGRLAKGIAMLRDDINNALKTAMKAQDQRQVSTLRLVNAAFKNADIEARGGSKGPLADDELLSVLQKMIKQRQESAELYDKGGRPELA